MLKYAIIGFGGLGKTHLVNLEKLSRQRGDFELCAICGGNKADLIGNVKLNLGEVDMSSINLDSCNFYTDYRELFEKENPDFVVCALPTYLHEEVACFALSKGSHVFSEKPMALTMEGCRNMIEQAKKSGKKLMIGNCLRFDGSYGKIKEYIDSGVYGKAYSARFSRYSQTPVWSWDNWLLDGKRSGGCALDMHVHDVDLINWYFGKPKALRSASTQVKADMESISTQYFYDDLLVLSDADWSMTQKFPFEARCIINFEKATVALIDGKLTVYTDDDLFCPEVSDKHFFEAEMEAFLESVIDGAQCKYISLESVCDSMEIVFAETESATKGISICF